MDEIHSSGRGLQGVAQRAVQHPAKAARGLKILLDSPMNVPKSGQREYPAEIYGDDLGMDLVMINRVVGFLLLAVSLLSLVLSSRSDSQEMIIPGIYSLLTAVCVYAEFTYRKKRAMIEAVFDKGVLTTGTVVSKRMSGRLVSIRSLPKMTFKYSNNGKESTAEVTVGSRIYFHFSVGDGVSIKVLALEDARIVPLLD